MIDLVSFVSLIIYVPDLLDTASYKHELDCDRSMTSIRNLYISLKLTDSTFAGSMLVVLRV